ncbi:hypothetical protein [Mucilaginibacter auburnensis]|uniref:Uncharacterized protein n=1 Tax=Mucilaginibacter auburnensis TaxID=1457233 RepID=A0A2H9VPW1_9SPHI|nr:hypothetical protein [Mucilaginibacter auburnensis]PJJ80356.1 hypothetical protein CLV57_3506 [Mucilaginibacter auburnensis]
MKFIASLLIYCIFMLSAFGGRVKPVIVATAHECCAKGDKHHCEKKEQKPVTEDCEKQGCNMLLTCSICGFLAVEPVEVKASAAIFIENPVPIYKSGNSTVYLPADWKPPKV